MILLLVSRDVLNAASKAHRGFALEDGHVDRSSTLSFGGTDVVAAWRCGRGHDSTAADGLCM